MTHPLGKHRLALVPMDMGGGGKFDHQCAQYPPHRGRLPMKNRESKSGSRHRGSPLDATASVDILEMQCH